MLPPPSILLGHDEFTDWYPGQSDTVSRILEWYNGPKRFMGLSAPTGSGKSIIAAVAGALTGATVRTLTHTKGLQDQLMQDFERVGMVDLRGQNNYQCAREGFTHLTPEDAPCWVGRTPCHLMARGCPYYDQLHLAQRSTPVVTNYAAWMSLLSYGGDDKQLGGDLLICDEASTAFSVMEGFFGFTITRSVLGRIEITLPAQADQYDWKQWLAWFGGVAAHGDPKRKREFETNQSHILGSETEWAVDPVGYGGGGFTFTPVWVSQYKGCLFGTMMPKVLLMSADLTKKDAYLLGITDDELEWYDMPSSFPPELTPMWHVKTTRVHYKMQPEDMSYWCSRIDQVIASRPDVKGLVFPVSYRNADYLRRTTMHTDRVVSHTSETAREVIRGFKANPNPKVLVSPAATMGYDFPGDQCRFIIVAKVPWPVTQTAVFKRRKEEDEEYVNHVIAKALVQECGRGTRSKDDWCEVFVVDDTISWWWRKNSHLMPKWFTDRWRGTVDLIPRR